MWYLFPPATPLEDVHNFNTAFNLLVPAAANGQVEGWDPTEVDSWPSMPNGDRPELMRPTQAGDEQWRWECATGQGDVMCKTVMLSRFRIAKP